MGLGQYGLMIKFNMDVGDCILALGIKKYEMPCSHCQGMPFGLGKIRGWNPFCIVISQVLVLTNKKALFSLNLHLLTNLKV